MTKMKFRFLSFPVSPIQNVSCHETLVQLNSNCKPFLIAFCQQTDFLNLGGGGLSESTDGRECAILALEVVPTNLIFA